jgi:RNA polymerase sigma-70 factor (ECF subfamily)
VEDNPIRLADVATHWSRVLQAQETQGDTAARARNDLLVRYHEAVQRYLRAELRDDNAADQLYSDFAVRVLSVDPFLKRADPERGRFRDYLKAVLRRMVFDHYRARGREAGKREPLLPDGDNEPTAPPASAEEDRRFAESWRQEMVNHAWRGLDQAEKQSGQPYYTSARLQEEQPGLRSAQLAEKLTAALGRPYTAAGVRKLVQRGRELFGELLVREVARSLRDAPGMSVNKDRLEQELIDLGLLFSYCKEALERGGDEWST